MKLGLIAMFAASLFASSAMAGSINVNCDFQFAGNTEPLQLTLVVEPPKLAQGQATHLGRIYVKNLGSSQLIPDVDSTDLNTAKFMGSYAELDWLRNPNSNLPVAHIRGIYRLKLKNETSLSLNFTAMLSSKDVILQRQSVFEGAGRTLAFTVAENVDRSNVKYGKVTCTNLTNFEL